MPLGWQSGLNLTCFLAPAVPNGIDLPADEPYLVKSELGSISVLVAAVKNSISNLAFESVKPVMENNRILISAKNVEIVEL
jgi:hypothetical protein